MTGNKYIELKEKHQKELNAFPMFAAFSNEQFYEGMQKFGLDGTKEKDRKQILSIGYGLFIRKADIRTFRVLLDMHTAEMQAEIEKDTTGEGFIYQMFYTEMANHECVVTKRYEEALDAVGISLKKLNGSKTLINGFSAARKAIEEDNVF